MIMRSILALLFSTNIAFSCGDFVEVPFQDSYICVSPDYYEVDGVRTPMGMDQIEILLDRYDAILPTPEMVDAIWQHADLRLSPIPMAPGPRMTSIDYYIRHDSLIDEQIGDRNFVLVAGHKKDVVQQQVDGRVSIYGWHRSDGTPIQPLNSTTHSENYFDYSHGIRLIIIPD